MDHKAILTFTDLTKINKTNKIYFDKENLNVELKNISIGEKIIHIKFGEGNIENIEGEIIFVEFSGKIKKFPYPGAFIEGFLFRIDK